jgi:AcrR family transcriptional regulator
VDEAERESYRLRVRRQHRAHILQVAEHHLASIGCYRFTLEIVASEVGLARTALYRHVRNRTALIEQILAEAGALARFDHVTQLAPSASLGTVLGAYARLTIQQTREHHAATGNHQLAYPCCLRQAPCPYARLDTVRPAIQAQLETTSRLRAVPASDLPRLAQLLRTVLCAVLIEGPDVDAEERDRAWFGSSIGGLLPERPRAEPLERRLGHTASSSYSATMCYIYVAMRRLCHCSVRLPQPHPCWNVMERGGWAV